jgi:replicative DNA helicase
VELSQLNRESDKTLVKRASQLRGSWSIEQDADMIWILDKEDETWEKLSVSVQKCRDWRIGDIYLKQISDIMKITDLPINRPF